MSVDIAMVRELARGQAMPLDEALIQVTCDELVAARAEVARLRARVDSLLAFRESAEGLPPGTLPRAALGERANNKENE